MPGAGDPRAWDRYSYVKNSPVVYNDPSGHKPCDNEFCQNDEQINKLYYSRIAKKRWGWSVSHLLSSKQMKLIYQTGNDLSRYIVGVTRSSGDGWIQKNLWNTEFKIGGFLQQKLSSFVGADYSVTFGNTISFYSRFEKGPDPKHHILHELGHVLDNNFGSTLLPRDLSDLLIKSFGGNPRGFRFYNQVNVQSDYKYPPGDYSNHSTADYFSEVLADLVYGMYVQDAKGKLLMNALFISLK